MGDESFKDIVSTEEELRSTLGYPSERVARKAIPSLDQHCLEFINQSPFLLLATSNDLGKCDVSPRGDAPGFVHILDENRLTIPGRPGNRRIDSMLNILSNPQIGLIFIIPGLEETLRDNGRACVVRDQDLLQKMEVKDVCHN
jgi:PPOX class probable FMN-dependent enzyme